jgi:MFS family permease
LGVLRHRDFSLFYGALVVAAIGGALQSFVNILLIYDLTHSPFHIGLTGLARAIPLMTLSLVGGVIADRVDRRVLIIFAQGTAAVLALVLAVLTVTGAIQVWHIYAVTLTGSCLMALSAPARGALIPNLVPRDQLMAAFALNSSTWQIANIVGPSLAGLLVAATGGFAAAYAANSGAHVVTLFCLAIMHYRPVVIQRRLSALKSVVEGLVFVRQRPIILGLLAMDAAAMLFGTYTVVFPVIGDGLGLNPAQLGLLFAAPGVGSLAGAAVVMSLGDIRYKGLFVAGAILAYCAALVVVAVAPIFALALLAAGALGLFDALQATPRNALIQLITPDEIRGRVEAFRHIITGGMPAMGQVYMGGMASLLGAPLALITGALACASVVLGVTATRPDLRARDIGGESEATPERSGAALPTRLGSDSPGR